MNIKEWYTPLALGVNEVRVVPESAVCGFIAVTAGTITVTAASDTNTGGPVTVLNTFPVAAGAEYKLGIFLGKGGGTVTLAGGASGTILVN